MSLSFVYSICLLIQANHDHNVLLKCRPTPYCLITGMHATGKRNKCFHDSRTYHTEYFPVGTKRQHHKDALGIPGQFITVLLGEVLVDASVTFLSTSNTKTNNNNNRHERFSWMPLSLSCQQAIQKQSTTTTDTRGSRGCLCHFPVNKKRKQTSKQGGH